MSLDWHIRSSEKEYREVWSLVRHSSSSEWGTESVSTLDAELLSASVRSQSVVRDLGVTLDCQLTMADHVTLQITNRSFRYASPHLWNQLPFSFRQPHCVHCPPGSPHPTYITSSQSSPSFSPSVTPATFHSRLKTRLFHKSFPP